MEQHFQHFPIILDQPIGMALILFYSFFKFPNEGKEPDCPKSNSEFVQEISMFEKQ